jgi:glycosyltransferase EpsF
MKVLHLITSLNRGGIESWLMHMVREIPRNVCAMDFCCKGSAVGHWSDEARSLGSEVFHCPLTPVHLSYLQKVTSILRNGNYDLIHNHLGAYSWLGVFLGRRFDLPVITSFHNTRADAQTRLTMFPMVRWLRTFYCHRSIAFASRHSDLVTGCSQGVLDALHEHRGFMPHKESVLYYGVNIPEITESTKRLAFRESMGWPSDAIVLLHVGRFCGQKNHEGILRIFQAVHRVQPLARLALIGDGLLRPSIEQLAVTMDMTDSIQFLGIRDDVSSIMTCADIFIFPSLFEGLGAVLLEANAAGLPVVGSDVAGLSEAVANGKTGFLHPVDDCQAMVQSILLLIQDPALRADMGAAGRERVRERFSTSASAKRLLEVYDECVSERKRKISCHPR